MRKCDGVWNWLTNVKKPSSRKTGWMKKGHCAALARTLLHRFPLRTRPWVRSLPSWNDSHRSSTSFEDLSSTISSFMISSSFLGPAKLKLSARFWRSKWRG